MVEGPGATRNGLKSKKLINRKILSVQCNCNPRVLSTNNEEKSEQPWFVDRYLCQTISIGKEVYLIFAFCGNKNSLSHPRSDMTDTSSSSSSSNSSSNTCDVALRLHFGMNGSLHINGLNANKKPHYKGLPTLCLTFGDTIDLSTTSDRCRYNSDGTLRTAIMETYQTTVSGPIMNANIARMKLNNFVTLDVCSDTFRAMDVLEKMKKHTNTREREISDVLLDQQIYPGVGNVIKIEGLHDASVHPKQILSSLSDEKLLLVIERCRSYAIRWFQDGRAPTKSVYNKTICGTCQQATISMQRVGGTNRTTFWCTQCQPLEDPNATARMGNDEAKEGGQYFNEGNRKGGNNNIIPNQQERVMPHMRPFQRVCPTHGPSQLILRRVRNGANTSRIFHTCQAKQCKYFSWADTYFPQCRCKKRAILLMSKTERSGGKWFFSCSNQNKKNKCGYFAWAQQKDLERLGELRPLL